MKNENENALAHGAGVGVLALLGMLGRCADDVARIGVGSVDDVGRACMTSADDIGSLMTRNGDDLFRHIDDFHAPNYVDDLRFEASTPRVIANEGENGVSVTTHVAKQLADATIKVVEIAANEDDK